ncbi:MAG: 16S rRNA (guanine(966)-N(2))-methyltransferase RsmD [Nitrospirota bacterium]|nr:16S rRNA (guanine(966)-N(2))-methyltransferase RsmD [Nitrospirota bacterium]
MKLVAGIQKGRRLKQPVTLGIRPTSAKVREAVFGILRDHVLNARVLDLFAGTGALGLEALSRGARSVMFVDHAPAALRVLQENILRCESKEKSLVIRQDVRQFLQTLTSDDHADRFDLIFADPPYHTGEIESVLELLGRTTILSPRGILVIEHFHKEQVPEQTGSLRQYREARYGDTTVNFFSMKSNQERSSCA